jgi:hypothetical protein
MSPDFCPSCDFLPLSLSFKHLEEFGFSLPLPTYLRLALSLLHTKVVSASPIPCYNGVIVNKIIEMVKGKTCQFNIFIYPPITLRPKPKSHRKVCFLLLS